MFWSPRATSNHSYIAQPYHSAINSAVDVGNRRARHLLILDGFGLKRLVTVSIASGLRITLLLTRIDGRSAADRVYVPGSEIAEAFCYQHCRSTRSKLARSHHPQVSRVQISVFYTIITQAEVKNHKQTTNSHHEYERRPPYIRPLRRIVG